MKYSKPMIHPSASKLVVRTLLKVKREMKQWNIREVARRLEVNQKYICENLKYGKEPTDKTVKGQTVRLKMGLKRIRKVEKKSDKPKSIKPDYIVQWDHLLKEERHKVIREYLKWKQSNTS